jgi:hypothetical protein
MIADEKKELTTVLSKLQRWPGSEWFREPVSPRSFLLRVRDLTDLLLSPLARRSTLSLSTSPNTPPLSVILVPSRRSRRRSPRTPATRPTGSSATCSSSSTTRDFSTEPSLSWVRPRVRSRGNGGALTLLTSRIRGKRTGTGIEGRGLPRKPGTERGYPL